MQKQLSPHVVEDLTFLMLYSCIQCKVILHLYELSHSGDKGLICPETCTECDPVQYVTFTDFCRVVHKTKPTHNTEPSKPPKRGVLPGSTRKTRPRV